jgi:hypothetical protein
VPLAVLRPDDWDFPLLLHVLGAMLLVGTLVVVVTALFAAWRNRDDEQTAALRRLAFATLLAGALPSYVLMRIGAEWIASEENLDDADVGWIDLGYIVADLGLVVMVLTAVLAGLAVRRGTAGGTLGRVAGVLAAVLVAAYVVAVWAMTTKPD